MKEIYQSSLLLIHSITRLCGICHKYCEENNEEVGEKLIEEVDNCEQKFLKVKQDIVKMVREIENQGQSEEILATMTEGGMLIQKEQKKQNE